jgi:hypothetical protein
VHTMDLSCNRLSAAAYVYLVKTISMAAQQTLHTLILDNCLLEKGLTTRIRNAVSVSLSRMVRKATRLRCLSLSGGYRAQVSDSVQVCVYVSCVCTLVNAKCILVVRASQ